MLKLVHRQLLGVQGELDSLQLSSTRLYHFELDFAKVGMEGNLPLT